MKLLLLYFRYLGCIVIRFITSNISHFLHHPSRASNPITPKTTHDQPCTFSLPPADLVEVVAVAPATSALLLGDHLCGHLDVPALPIRNVLTYVTNTSDVIILGVELAPKVVVLSPITKTVLPPLSVEIETTEVSEFTVRVMGCPGYNVCEPII